MRHAISGTTAAVAALALGLAGCHPARFGQGRPHDDRPMTVNARLDCPDREGDLRRVDQAADGRSCRYSGDDGEEVTLGLLDLGGRPLADALAPTEASLRSLVPAAVPGSPENAAAKAKSEASGKDNKDGDASDDDDKAATTGGAPGAGGAHVGENQTAVAEWSADTPDQARRSGHAHDHVAINLPGVHLDADDGGARVHAFGQDVVASDQGGADVHAGWNGVKSEIHADDGGVEIRSGWTGEHALDESYFLASDTAGPGGEQAVGYVVRGPVKGPLVIAISKARSGGDDSDEDHRLRDAKRLVRRNTRFD